MTTYESLLSVLYNVIKNAGLFDTVYDYERLVDNKKFQELFVSGGKIDACTITRNRTKDNEYVANMIILRNYEFTIRLYMSVDDANASEKTFNTKIDALLDLLDTNSDLLASSEIVMPSQLEIAEPRLVAGVLVHFARIKIVLQVSVQ